MHRCYLWGRRIFPDETTKLAFLAGGPEHAAGVTTSAAVSDSLAGQAHPSDTVSAPTTKTSHSGSSDRGGVTTSPRSPRKASVVGLSADGVSRHADMELLCRRVASLSLSLSLSLFSLSLYSLSLSLSSLSLSLSLALSLSFYLSLSLSLSLSISLYL